jgi:hypothetical protein
MAVGSAYTLAAQDDQFDPQTPADFRFKILGPDGQAVTDYRPLRPHGLHELAASGVLP